MNFLGWHNLSCTRVISPLRDPITTTWENPHVDTCGKSDETTTWIISEMLRILWDYSSFFFSFLASIVLTYRTVTYIQGSKPRKIHIPSINTYNLIHLVHFIFTCIVHEKKIFGHWVVDILKNIYLFLCIFVICSLLSMLYM